MNRRGFLVSLASLLAAPPIVRASSLMPLSYRRFEVLPEIETVVHSYYSGRQIMVGTRVVLPDGSVHKRGLQYWNRRPIEVVEAEWVAKAQPVFDQWLKGLLR